MKHFTYTIFPSKKHHYIVADNLKEALDMIEKSKRCQRHNIVILGSTEVFDDGKERIPETRNKRRRR